MIVEVTRDKTSLGSGTRPNRIDTVLRTPVEGAVPVALVENEEQCRTLCREGLAVENIRHKPAEIVVSCRD
jgi:hypothetical protein